MIIGKRPSLKKYDSRTSVVFKGILKVLQCLKVLFPLPECFRDHLRRIEIVGDDHVEAGQGQLRSVPDDRAQSWLRTGWGYLVFVQ